MHAPLRAGFMSYPTDTQLDDWAHTLSRTDWTKLATRIKAAIDRDRRGGSAIPDGFPSGTGGVGGHSGFTVEGEFIPATSVEMTALARTQARDEHHDRTTAACKHYERTITALATIVGNLDTIEARAHHDGTADDIWCAHHLQFQMTEPRYRGDLCLSCYLFKNGKGADEPGYGVLPPFALLDDKARGRSWTVALIERRLAETSTAA